MTDLRERTKGSMPIPVGVLEQVKRVAGFGRQDDGLGESPLDEAQTRQVARILDFNPERARFYCYFEPCEPPQNDGLQLEAQSCGIAYRPNGIKLSGVRFVGLWQNRRGAAGLSVAPRGLSPVYFHGCTNLTEDNASLSIPTALTEG
jgi:hypothetical protein